MKKLLSTLCFLILVWSLLASHLSLLPDPSPPQAAAQGADDVPLATRNDATLSLLFADDFESGSGDWDLSGDWELQMDDGNQVLHGAAFATAYPNTTWDDYRVEARVRVLDSSSEAKIALRVGEGAAGYYLELAGAGTLRLDKWDGSDWTNLGLDSVPDPVARWHTLALEGEGEQLRAYVDGELKIESSDASYADGSPMLNVPLGEADFDDVWVMGDAPAACAIVPSNGLNNPFGIAFNSQGELFAASGGKVSRATDEGQAVFVAQGADPGDMAIDAHDNLYVTGPAASLIFKITPDGTRTDFVTGFGTPWNIASGPDGYLYVTVDADILRVDLDDASVSPWMEGVAGAMAFDDAGILYTQANETLRKITPEQEVSTITVLPTIRPYKQYSGIAVDGGGNLYVGESLGPQWSETAPPWAPPVVADKVYKITPDGQVSTFASGLGGVWDLTFGPDGYLYVTEHDFSGISRIAPDGTVTPVVPCNGLTSVDAATYSPDGVLYFVNTESVTVGRLDAQGQVESVGSGFNVAGCGGGRPALAFNAAGELFVAEAHDFGPNRITQVAEGVATVFTHDVDCPNGLALDETSGDWYVSEGLLGNVVRFSPDGVRHDFVSGLDHPLQLAFGSDGLLYVAETDANRVSQIDASGSVTPFVTLPAPFGLVFWGDDLFVISDSEKGEIWRVDPTGTATLFANGPSYVGGITVAP
ncbi:MAG: hypothetical protein PVF45_06830, partial [Anaerolineae bacterium]